MPKKTKKEKIIAELRRKLEKVQTKNINTEESPLIKEKEQKTNLIREELDSFVKIPNKQFQTQTTSFVVPTSYIIKDLRKTFLLAGFAIFFELVVYWLTELEGSRFLTFIKIPF